MKRPFFYFLTMVALLLPGCTRGKDVSSTPIALVNGDPITRKEFLREISLLLRHASSAGEKPGMEIKAELLNTLVEKKLIAQQAGKIGITVSNDEIDKRIEEVKKDYPGETFNKMIIDEYVNLDEWKEKVRDDLLIGKVIDQVVGKIVSVPDNEARGFYEAHVDDYVVPDQVRARQILVGTEEKAREVLKRLNKGEKFETVAREVSLSPDRDKGGDLGFFPRGQMPQEFEDACFALRPGGMSGIVRSPHGYHIFLVEERRKGRRLEFDDVREKIMERIRQDKRESAFDEWMKGLKKSSKITVESDLLKDL